MTENEVELFTDSLMIDWRKNWTSEKGSDIPVEIERQTRIILRTVAKSLLSVMRFRS